MPEPTPSQIAQISRAVRGLGLQAIRTDYWTKPGPTRAYDWSAVFADTYDYAPDGVPQPIGYGSTEAEAVINLLQQADDT